MTKEESIRRANYWLAIIAILQEEVFSDVADYVEVKLVQAMNGVTDPDHGFFTLESTRSWNLDCGFFWSKTFDHQRFNEAHSHLVRTNVYKTLRSQ